MKTTAIICEFNPLHNGHKYLIDKAKENDGRVIAIMSGNFVQRGDVAIISKFSRAKSALQNGADLVIELPVVNAVASAKIFALGAVRIANALNCVDELAFGSESGSIDEIKNAVDALNNLDCQKKIKELMKNGEYYPRALEKAVSATASEQTAQVFKSPNNILAIEYILALKETNSKISPVTYKRIGVSHDSEEAVENIASASFIRKELLENNKIGNNISKYVPISCENDLNNPDVYAKIENLEKAILYKLRSMKSCDFAELPDVSEGLENRLYNAAKKATSLNNFLEICKTKRYTYSKLRRIVIFALLGITKDMQENQVNYLRVLGFNKFGVELLKNAKLPTVINLPKDIKKLELFSKQVLEKDILATDIFNLAKNKIGESCTDFTNFVNVFEQ